MMSSNVGTRPSANMPKALYRAANNHIGISRSDSRAGALGHQVLLGDHLAGLHVTRQHKRAPRLTAGRLLASKDRLLRGAQDPVMNRKFSMARLKSSTSPEW